MGWGAPKEVWIRGKRVCTTCKLGINHEPEGISFSLRIWEEVTGMISLVFSCNRGKSPWYTRGFPIPRRNQVTVDPGLLLPAPTAHYKVPSSSDAFKSCLVVSPLKHCVGWLRSHLWAIHQGDSDLLRWDKKVITPAAGPGLIDTKPLRVQL